MIITTNYKDDLNSEKTIMSHKIKQETKAIKTSVAVVGSRLFSLTTNRGSFPRLKSFYWHRDFFVSRDRSQLKGEICTQVRSLTRTIIDKRPMKLSIWSRYWLVYRFHEYFCLLLNGRTIARSFFSNYLLTL